MAQVKIPPISRIDSVELSLFEALQLSPGSLREMDQSSDSDLSEPTSEAENIISKLQREREQHMAQVAHSFNVNTPAGFVLETDTEALKEFESEQKTSDGAVSEQWINRYFTRANENDISVFITNGSCNDPANPLILIVVAKEYDPNDSKRLSKVRAIVSTMEKDEKVLLLASSLKSSKGAAGSPSKSKLSDKKILQALQPDVSEKKFHKLKSVTPELMQGLLAMIRLRAEFLHVDQKYKAGVVYFNGQQNDQQLLEDQRRSAEYKEFVHILGQEIPLKDFGGFTGGLDTRSNKDGETFICTRWRSSEYAFHVADLISGGAHNRKVHLGNNAVNVVFVDPNSKLPFDPSTIASKFNQIFLVVSMETGSDAASRHLACKKPKTVRPSLSLSSSFRDDTSSTESNSEDISESYDSKSVRSSPGNVFHHRSASSETAIVIPPLSKKNVSNPALTLQTRKSHRMKFVEEKDVFYKVCVIRKDTVPVGSENNKPSSAPDYYVYKHNAEFRDTLLQLIKSCQVASYKAKNFEDRITNNRKSFLQSVQKSAFGSIDK